MGGKASQSSQQIQIPPEVLARYNSVNATAENAAQTPFQQYSTDPNAFVAPLNTTQQAGISGANQYANAAQPYYQAATQQLGAAQNAATPYYGQATQQVGQAQNVGNMLGGASLGALAAGQAAADPLQQQASYGLGAAYGQAQPFNQAASGRYQQAFGQGQNLTQGALGGVQGAYAGAQPFQGIASQYLGAGAQAVNPGELGSNQINQYMSPFIGNVLQGTAGMLNQQNQQAMSGQTGNAIKQGAFGGDRAGIAAANLAQQQQLANAQTYSGILNQGYGQALSAAQGQQQLGLGAQQANRAALQQASQQALGIGQQGFGQGMSAAQQQAALGQQLYGMGSGTGQNLASLGQQIYGQGTGTAQQQAALGQQLFGQGVGTSQQLGNIGQQQFGQGMTTAQQNAALGAGIYGMGSQTAQGLANLGTGAQGAGLQGAQSQLAAGLGAQQTAQAGNTALYNQFLQQQSYPFQTAQFLANIAEGTGALSGSTTNTSQALGGFSDKRLKENIKLVGKTFDGQNIYSYNFKGHPQTEIGLIAQEVEKKHPEAVGLAGGYKTVRYDKATDDAADRGHFATGGVASMGGGVMPEHAGLGFADGGYAGFDPALMQQLMAAYQQMYAPMQGQKGGLNAAGYVPEVSSNIGSLQTAGPLPEIANPMASAEGLVNLGTGIDKLGTDTGLFNRKDKRTHLQRNFDEMFPTEKAFGGLAGARHGYAGDGKVTDNSADDEIVVTAAKQPTPAPEPKKIDVPSATPAAAPLAQVAKVGNQATSSKPSINTSSLNIPQIGNTVGLNSAAALTPLEDHTMEGIGSILGGLGSMGVSDKRLKQNIKPVGKTFDGQTVYSYNYKGDHQTRMGLIAQEVEKKHPEAVKKVNGYRMVDYHKATGLAAHRGHFADGGDAESTDDTSAFGGPSIPMQGNTVGLNGAAGLTALQDHTLEGIGSMAQGVGSIAKAFKKKAAGAAAGGLAGGNDNDKVNPIRAYLMHKLNPLHIADDDHTTDQESLWGLGSEPQQEPLALTGVAPQRNSYQAASLPIVPQPKAQAGLAAASVKTDGVMSDYAGTHGSKVDPEIVSFFMDKGLTEGQALGIAAGIHAESSSNPSAMNKQSGAMGLGQWLGPRKAGVLKQFGANPSKNDQLEYLWGELTGGDRGGASVLAQKDPKSVLGAYITKFMRPAAGYETESDIARGHSAMGYAAGGPAGDPDPANLETRFDDVFGKIGATPDENDPRLNPLYKDDSPTGLAAATKPVPLPTADREAANAITGKAALSKAMSPADNELLQRSAPDDAERGKFMQFMAKNGIGVENMPKPNQTGPYNLLSGQTGGLSPPPAAAPTEKPAPKDRGVLGNILHGKFIGGLGQGDANSWIPLLTGLGTFATTPTRSVLGGALAGIGAGAQAAQAQREYSRQMAETPLKAVWPIPPALGRLANSLITCLSAA